MIYVYGLPAELVAGGSDVSVAPGRGAVVITGFAPSVSTGSDVAASPGIGHAVLTGHAPAVTTGNDVSAAPGAGAVSVAGHAPTVTATSSSTDVSVAPGAGRVVIAGHAPGVTEPVEAPRGGAADRRRKKKRKPVARVLKSLGDLSEVTTVYEPLAEPASPPAPAVEAPAFGDVLRRLDAERAVRDRIQAENAAETARRQAEDDAVAAVRQAAADAAKAEADRKAEERRQADLAVAQSKRLQGMVDAWNALLKRKADEDEEDVEQLILEAW